MSLLTDMHLVAWHILLQKFNYKNIFFKSIFYELYINWCKGPDRGLPNPDIIFFMQTDEEMTSQRGGFGEEAYEKKSF